MIGSSSFYAYVRIPVPSDSRVMSVHIRSNDGRSRMFTFDPNSINSSTQCSLVVNFTACTLPLTAHAATSVFSLSPRDEMRADSLLTFSVRVFW